MWARVASFEGGDWEQIREMGQRRMQDSSGPAGAQGVLVLASDDRTKRLFVTFFDSLEAIEAAEPEFEKMGDEMPEEVRGRRVSVDHYEVVFERMPQTTAT